MASILAAGAGASKGLQDYLVQMLRERQMDEEVRSNKAREGLSGRQIDETAAYRRDQQESTNLAREQMHQDRQSRSQNMMTDNMRAALDDLMPGVQVSPTTRELSLRSGAATPERFKEQVIPDDFVGPIQEDEPQRGDVVGYTLAPGKAERVEKAETPVSRQRDTFVIDGKPEEISIDPRTDEMRILTGPRAGQVAKPGEAKHYVKPPTTSFSAVQTGNGILPFNRRTGMFGGGQGTSLPQTAEERNRSGAIQRVQPMLDAIAELSPRINTKQGIEATIQGGWRTLTARANYDDDVAEYVSVIEAFTPLLARAQGHTGVLTERDFEHSMRILPTPRDSETLAKRKLARLNTILSGASETGSSAPTGAPSGKKVGRFEIIEEK